MHIARYLTYTSLRSLHALYLNSREGKLEFKNNTKAWELENLPVVRPDMACVGWTTEKSPKSKVDQNISNVDFEVFLDLLILDFDHRAVFFFWRGKQYLSF